MAFASLKRMEKYLSPENQQKYNDFMQCYLDMDHMELIPREEIRVQPRAYLPHHAVLRPSSLTTSLRVVFNGSAKNNTGCSLNEALMIGPTIQPDLFTLLLQFRQYPIAVSADISKMYRCIEVHAADRDMQRILYRFHPDKPIQQFRLKTITYGTSSAPFLATRCLQKIADDNFAQFPVAANSIRSEFYMDDWLSGGHTVNEAIIKQRQVHDLLARHHLPLVKYSSNSQELLALINNQLIEPLKAVEFNSADVISLLGLKWIQEQDTIGVNLNPEPLNEPKFTKRSTLSLVSRVFDPLGILAPVTITGKILIQHIWRAEIGWDVIVPAALQVKIEQYLWSLQLLQEFHLRRPYHHNYRNCERQLVGFSDASEQAYAAVLYLRLIQDTKVETILVCSKTRVAPIKALTIPRLELCGAVLLTQLANRVRKILHIPLDKVVCFSDSTIALSWIRGPAENYPVFIKNRSNFIKSVIPDTQWYHIRGDQNPADLCTRGVSTEKFLQLSDYWNHGPKWLIENFEEFLMTDIPAPESICEMHIINVTTVSPAYFERFSSFQRLVRVSAYHLRFFDRTHLKLRPQSTALTKEDVERATFRIIQRTQQAYFPREYTALQNGEKLPVRSNLNTLAAFLHTDLTIRVGGRLENSTLPFDQKHPVILPRHSHLAKLIVRDLHLKYYHASISSLIPLVRSHWWIIGGHKKLIKSIVHQCVFCSKLSAHRRTQLMANLPAARVRVSRPFSHTGIDFAGPLSVKCTNHRSTKVNKAYLAVFVCFVTKAIHIEVASAVSTEAFVLTFDRFISRRGVPAIMYSDNGTNFVGFANILSRDKLVDYATRHDFRWSFIPARSPHMGGLWEAAIKSCKTVLLKAIGQQTLTLEVLNTFSTKVEAILNSRPLCANPASEFGYLSPGHFLIGSSLLDIPSIEDVSLALPRRYKVFRQAVDSFWSHWHKDYLHQLQVRTKWKTRVDNVKVGDVAILRTENTPVLSWPLARVVNTFPGPDGAVRSVEVDCRGKVFRRAVHNLVLLPVE